MGLDTFDQTEHVEAFANWHRLGSHRSGLFDLENGADHGPGGPFSRLQARCVRPFGPGQFDEALIPGHRNPRTCLDTVACRSGWIDGKLPNESGPGLGIRAQGTPSRLLRMYALLLFLDEQN